MKTEYYVTKYCLTKGILLLSGEVTETGNLKVDGYYSVLNNTEFFFTEAEAIEDAKRRKKKKIQSLKKQLKKMKALEF